MLSLFLNIRGNSEGLGNISYPPIHPTDPFRSTEVCSHCPHLYRSEAPKHGDEMGTRGHARSLYTYKHRDMFPCSVGGICTRHMLTCSRERPRGLIKGLQARTSREGHILYAAGMIRCWDSLVVWSLGIATWILCGMNCHPLWAVSCKPTPTAVGWDSLLHRWHLAWGSGEEPHHFSVSPGWDVYPKDNGQMRGLLVCQKSKFNWRSFETEVHKTLLKAWRQHTDLPWTGLKEWRKGAEGGHLEMSKQLGSSLEIQICMCKNIYWACFAVACICHCCQIVSREWQWNSRSCFFFNTFELGSCLFQKCSFPLNWKIWWVCRIFLGCWIITEV